MLEDQGDGLKDGIKLVSDVIHVNSNTGLNWNAHMQVKVEQTYALGSIFEEDEILEVQCLLAEPHAFDEIIYRDAEKASMNDKFFCPDDLCGKGAGLGLPDSGVTASRLEGQNCEFIDDILQVPSEEENLQSVYPLFNTGANYHLDSAHPERCHSDFASCSTYIEHLSPSCHIFPVGETTATTEKSTLSANLFPEPFSDQSAIIIDNMSVIEPCNAFKFGANTCTMDTEWLKDHILFGLHNLIDVDIDIASNLLVDGLSPTEKEDNMVLIHGNFLAESLYNCVAHISNDRGVVTGGMGISSHSIEDVLPTTYLDGIVGSDNDKRDVDSEQFQRHNKKYCEEIVDTASTYGSNQLVAPVTCSRALHLHVKENSSSHCLKHADGKMLFYQETPLSLDSRPPCGPRTQRGRPRKNMNLIASNLSVARAYNLRSFTVQRCWASGFDSEGDAYCVSRKLRKRKIVGRRKKHRQWTLSEVVKLVEGVTQYGVGKWTEIKKLMFSGSAYRTSVDLKDKWRNLLKASGGQFNGRIKLEVHKKKPTVLPMPKYLRQQIRELSVIHPYPRERKPGQSAFVCEYN